MFDIILDVLRGEIIDFDEDSDSLDETEIDSDDDELEYFEDEF
jgi:hypothetical protein